MVPDDLKPKLLKIKIVILDVDGVLTDGRIIYGDHGDELKFFDVQDGLGMALLRRAGLKTMIISAKKSKINARRAKELDVVKIFQGAKDKLAVYEKILRKFKVTSEEVCFIGDDLLDLPVIKRCGFGVAVHNAVQEVKNVADYVTHQKGGRGAVREVVDLLLKAQGSWTAATEKYFS
jgi:3-deoxy-D-manno-octulosonate 8-phosphate phosphatase (KDO 8-P phosphatase)